MNINDRIPDVQRSESHRATPRYWLHKSLPGEYLSMALMIQAGFGAAFWALSIGRLPAGMILVAAGVWIVSRSAGAFSGRWLAPLITIGIALAVFVLWKSQTALPHRAMVVFSPPVFLAMLTAVLATDLVQSFPLVFVARHLRGLNWHRLVVWGFGLALIVYVVVLPSADLIIERKYPPKSGYVLEDMSLAERVRLRSMEAITALWFFALGATVGSFLNVVAYRAPRGKSVAFGLSRCPQCGTRIKGRDNVPILGWLWLRGRCRDCQGAISPRYPIVELISAALFLLLYFVELISGGANIPVRQPKFYHGVVWIIFYTKWDLIGLYLYHCFAMSILLTCVLIDIDRERVPSRTRWIVGAALFLPPLIWPELLAVPCFADADSWFQSPRLMAVVSCLAGGALGAALGWLTARGVETSTTPAEHSEMRGRIAVCLAVVGISLGWQAAIAVTLFALLILLASASVAGWQRLSLPRMPLIVLVAFVVHQILWRWTIEHGSTWWPSHRTSASGWIAVFVGYVVLLLANRLVIRQRNNAGPIAHQLD